MKIVLGIDQFEALCRPLLGEKQLALITSSSAINQRGIPVYDIILKKAGKNVKSIWALQHGFFIDKQDNMILSSSFFWQELAIPIYSLYAQELLPNPEWLSGIDAILIDIFDVGTRVYTFINHIIKILKFIEKKGIEVIILDRPNPLNGIDLEGPLCQPDHFSMVGMLPIPMRHGLTGAECLLLAKTYYKLDMDLKIIKVKNWQRHLYPPLIWTTPSPNMTSFASALVYPGAVMLEGTNISEGRGTSRPFELIGSPYINNHQLIKEIYRLPIKSACLIPIYFKPEFSKYRDEICQGILICPKKKQNFSSFELFYEIIRLIAHQYPQQFKWKEPPYEFEYKKPPIDMICGSSWIRQCIEKNLFFHQIKADIDRELDQYRQMISARLLY